MEPALHDGDVVRCCPDTPVVLGCIVVAKHPFVRDVFVIKRVERIVEGFFDLRGDNPASSTDSRSLGCFEPARILGVVV